MVSTSDECTYAAPPRSDRAKIQSTPRREPKAAATDLTQKKLLRGQVDARASGGLADREGRCG